MASKLMSPSTYLMVAAFLVAVSDVRSQETVDEQEALGYESRLFNETAPVEDFHFHPVEPRELRLRLRDLF